MQINAGVVSLRIAVRNVRLTGLTIAPVIGDFN